ncbi:MULTISPECIES: SDR family NAD(P)-dependent oxidoreductase [Olivibacter]|jgi:NAD(P)-dependent dehydrogenase (short-subunit alcohol dehydrogenase family)|uniref:SDR family NAD(P)-dependent oxidoreductase n=1 Tax=Olivibacter jilunii TaxID=985016 RepID=A0ABW6B1Z5_9SPHI|nr:SDR family NAD(P)-dependent oxidoreductase [Olivibacter jilunii]MCL4639516.1 SDR family NAD(P)-dependent oxidoreductase [Olivibacter sp. UJ_SKK_5.1]MDX3915451.1 SDR family NAD(P)-dependent oxidoreductase [Pseudosphingobacterium sp.]
MDTTKKVWLVTGASKGLGLSLVKKLLAQNYRVVATSRNIQSLIAEVGEVSDVFLPLEVRLTDNEHVKEGIAKSIAHFGQLDVIVNNAGFGQIGTLEELTDEEARNSFDVNVFGSLNVIRNAMPYLRKNRSGHIFNIASVGGFSGAFPGWGIYCATKFAVVGFTESLAEEVKGLGVHATVVYPGYFRTDFLAKGSVKTPQHTIEEYEAARQSQQAHLSDINGNQPNDPEKAAEVLIAISKEEKPPVHLFLGSDAYDIVYKKVDFITSEVEQWKSYTLSTAL